MSLAEKLAAERRGRLAAERLLELKQAELYAANRKLGLHARALSEEIVETRAEVASVRDENRRVKSDLSVATHNLEIAERRLWHSIQTIQDGFAFFDNDDHLIAANDAYMLVFEGLEEIKPGVAYARILQLLTEEGIVDTGQLSLADWRAFMLRRRQEAAPEPVVLRLWNDEYVKLMDHRGAGGDLVSLGLNITSTVQYERELKDARLRAEAAARAKSAFLANMSHEIRTPMNGVVGMAELLAESELNEEQNLYVSTIRNSGEALLVIINDILDYSKIEAEKMVLHEAPFDLEKSVHEVQMLVQPAAREKGLALLLDYDMFLPQKFVGDIGRIRQILTNLIGNAVKFTSGGHVLIRITGAPNDAKDRMFLHIAIEDTGIGIAQDKLEQIFAEFTQVEDERNRKFEGTGLGLAISKKLVELMGGEIWAESEEGVGSCFGFRIPLSIAEAVDIDSFSLPETLKKVMVVDNNEINRDIIRRQLEFMNVATEGFLSGADALQHLEEGFDLILLEHDITDTPSAEFVAAVRANNPNIPIVILTSNPGAMIDQTLGAQISTVLPRPLHRERLISALKELGANIGNSSGDKAITDESVALLEAPVSDVSLEQAVISEEIAEPVPELETEPAASEVAVPDVAPETESALPPQDEIDIKPMFQRHRPRVAESDRVVDVPLVAEPAPAAEPEPSPTDTVAETLPSAPADQITEPNTAPLSTVESLETQTETDGPPLPETPAPTIPFDEMPAPVAPVETAEQPDMAELSTVEVEVEHVELAPLCPIPSEPDSAESLPETARKMRILAAEDNKTNQLVFRKMIKTLDIELRIANNGVEAVEAYQEFEPDMVFMDISMPEMDGKEATGAIRKLEEASGAHIPIVALTAHAQDGDEAPILQAGLDYYLTKPLRKPAILEMVSKLVPDGVSDPFPKDEDLRQAG